MTTTCLGKPIAVALPTSFLCWKTLLRGGLDVLNLCMLSKQSRLVCMGCDWQSRVIYAVITIPLLQK